MEKTIEQVQKDYALEKGFVDFANLISLYVGSGYLIELKKHCNQVAIRYAQQFQSPTDALNTEIMVLRERVSELESCLSKHLTFHNAEMEALQMPTSKDWYELYSETESLINKSK